jgi:Bacterial Ig-like domain (group 4).
MNKKTKYLAVLSAAAITTLLSSATVFAADGEVYDIATGSVKYTLDDLTSLKNQLDAGLHSSKYGYESNGKVYNLDKVNEVYKAEIKAGNTDLASILTKVEETVTPTPIEVAKTTKTISAIDAITVNNGTTADKLGLPTTVGVTLSDDTTDVANVTWDTSAFDGTKAGDVTITGTLAVPTGKNWTLTDAQKAVTVKVTVNEVSALTISSVSAVTSKTTVQVVLADGQDDTVAADKASYVVKVGDTDVAATAVSYVKDAKKATLTVDLSGKEGTVTVNGVAATAAIDFKAPEVTNVIPVNLTTVYVDFSEKLDAASAGTAGNYGLVVKGTATLGSVTSATLVSDTRVKLTVGALKEGTTYTLTIAGVTDASSVKNVIAASSKELTAVGDTTKPLVTGVTQVDGASNATLTVKFSEEVNGDAIVSLQKYNSDGTLGTATTYNANVANTDSVDVTVPRLDDASKYCVTVTGDTSAGKTALADIAGNKLDEQKVDLTAVKDTVAPTVVSTESKDGKLTITFSEKLVAGTLIAVKDASTGANATAALDVTNTDATKLVYTLTGVTAGKNYVARLTAVTDLAGNTMDAQNVAFVGTQAVSKVQVSSATSTPQTALVDASSNALAALAENTVVVTFNTTVTKTEAENIANYKIYVTGDKTKTLAVTKAVYDDTKKTVTLTTADQVKGTANYTVEVTGVTNLNTTGTTATFNGVDYKAPVLKSVTQPLSNALKVTFDEAVTTTGAKATLVSTDYSDAITLSTTVDIDGNLILGMSKALTAGKTYILRLEGVQDAYGNYRAAGSTSAVVTSTELQLDAVAPKLASTVALNARNVELTFDEDLDAVASAVALNVSVKDSEGNSITVTPAVSGKKVTLTTTSDAFLTGKTYSVEIYGVTDLVGNDVKATNKVTATFSGNKDEVSPKLVSAASSVVKATDYKVNGAVVTGLTATNYTKVTLTFDETVQLAAANNIAATITAPDFSSLTVVANSAKVGEDGKTVEFLLNESTNPGDQYIVNVTPAAVTDIAATPNILDDTANYASFAGVDTKAPTLTSFSLADKDGKTPATVGIVGNTITISVGAATAYSTGSIKISEDSKVSLDSKVDTFDVSGISVSKDLDTSALTNLALGLYGVNGATGDQIKAILDGSTITLEDAAGNSTAYTVTVTE